MLRRRLDGARAAARAAERPLYLVSGGAGGSGWTEAVAMRRYLAGAGVPAEDVVEDPDSRDTLEQVRRLGAWLASAGPVDRVLVCTSAWHQPRCRLLLRLLGVRTEAPSMPPDRPHLGTGAWLAHVAREVPATAWDAALLIGLRLLGRPWLEPPRPPGPDTASAPGDPQSGSPA